MKNMLTSENISNKCLKEFIQGDYRNGNIFNMKTCLAKADEKHIETKNKPIDSEEDLLTFLGGTTGVLSEWEYIGSIDQHQIIRTNIDGDTWRSYEISIIRIIGDEWGIVSKIEGPKKSEILSAKILENTIHYDQSVTGGSFFYIMQNQLHPSASLLKISGELKTRENESIGSITYRIQLDKQGKLFDKKIISFTPNEGWAPYSGKEYKAEELESLFKELCIKM